MDAPLTVSPDLLRRMKLPRVSDEGDKESRGRVLVVAGSRELAGAAILAATAALRAGAGKLQVGAPASIALPLGLALPEARVIAWDGEESGDADLVRRARKAQAVVAGCGMENGPGLERLLGAVLDCGVRIPLILDAAALHCLPALEKKVRTWAGGVVILPHPGEMARLLGRSRGEIEADPAGAARSACQRFGTVAAVKGPRTVIAAPDGRVFVQEGGGVGLATSGSGDVLAGLAGGLAARGANPLSAALLAAWLHAEAGAALARSCGRIGYLAREIAPLVPGLLDRLENAD